MNPCWELNGDSFFLGIETPVLKGFFQYCQNFAQSCVSVFVMLQVLNEVINGCGSLDPFLSISLIQFI